MLRYSVNRQEARTNLRKLDVDSYTFNIDDVDIDDTSTLTTDDRERVGYTVTVTCHHPHELSVGDKVAMTVTREVAETAGEENNIFNFYEEYPVRSVSQDGLSFTIDAPVYYRLHGERARLVDESVSVPYLLYSNSGVEQEYLVTEHRRYMYLYFTYDHFFGMDGYGDNTLYITSPNYGEFENLEVKCEYVARNVLRIWVPKSDSSSDDLDRISVYNRRFEFDDYECDGGSPTCNEEGYVVCNGETDIFFRCDDSGRAGTRVYYETPIYYYDTEIDINDGEYDEDDWHPWMKVTSERIEENGDTFSICDNVLCVLIGECDSETDPECYGGVKYRKLDREEYDALEDYMLSEDGTQAYIKDYAYTFIPGRSEPSEEGGKTTYYLLSNSERYEEQQRLYPDNGTQSNEWILNHTLFGDNVDAMATVSIESYDTFRDSFFLNNTPFKNGNRVTFSVVTSICSVDIPFSHIYSTDMNSEAFTDEFIAQERENAINPIREMEKNVYHPIVEVSEGEFGKVSRIQFNLHFRRRDDNWNVVPRGFWNGVMCKESTDGETGGVSLNYRIQEEYFPICDIEHKELGPERWSDLLSLARFTNNDVRYQKNVLKKSFLRLSFYDSDDETRQRLLAYYTVFYDSGRAFKRFSQNFDTTLYYGNENHTEWGWDGSYKIIGRYGPYEIKDSQDNVTESGYKIDIETNDPVWGARVSREVNYALVGSETPEELADRIEEHRLSTQFTVESRNTSTSSSEGFYVYLWKDDYDPPYGVGGCKAGELYMRVEFNHAGFGRTIPFMMPHSEGSVLSFDGILDQWNTDPKANDINRYRNYAYIKLKRGYDAENGRFYYYPDPDRYGYAGQKSLYYDSATDTLMYNLYEGKIYEGEPPKQDEEDTEGN